MRALRLAFPIISAAILAAGLMAATPASAATTPRRLSPTAAGTLPPATRSTYLAGDQVNGLTVKRASVTFTLPAMTCPDSTVRGIFLGVGDELEVGNPTIVAGVEVACSGFETPFYGLDSYVLGTDHFLTAGAAGDVITIRYAKSPTTITATVNDRTTGQTVTTTSTTALDPALMFGMFPAFFSTLPAEVPQFALARMRSATVNGADLSTLAVKRFNRVSNGLKRIITSDFSPTGGFTLRFVNN